MKDILNYEGLYAITEDGKVWSYPKKIHHWRGGYYFTKGKFLQSIPHLAKQTHSEQVFIGLTRDSKTKMYKICRLVYEAYKHKIPEGYVVEHIDKDVYNNHLNNLTLVKRGYTQLGIIAFEKNKYSPQHFCRAVKAHTGEEFQSIKDAAIFIKSSTVANGSSNIVRVIKSGKTAGRHPATNEPLRWQYINKKG